MENILEPIDSSPKLSLYVEQLQTLLNKEKTRWQRFYNEIMEDQKAEFINGKAVSSSLL